MRNVIIFTNLSKLLIRSGFTELRTIGVRRSTIRTVHQLVKLTGKPDEDVQQIWIRGGLQSAACWPRQGNKISDDLVRESQCHLDQWTTVHVQSKERNHGLFFARNGVNFKTTSLVDPFEEVGNSENL